MAGFFPSKLILFGQSVLGLILMLSSLRPLAALHISLNKTNNVWCLEDKTFDGSYNQWCLILSKKLQVWKTIVLGEFDLGQPAYHILCFADNFNPKRRRLLEAIFLFEKVATSLSKETADVDLGMKLNIIEGVTHSEMLKGEWAEVSQYCSGSTSVHMSKNLIDEVSHDDKNAELYNSIEALPVSNATAYPLCEEASSMWELGCICQRTICIPWFPCGVKSCLGGDLDNDSTGKQICGISGCKICHTFEFFVPRKRICFWNTGV